MGNPFVHIELQTDDIAQAKAFYTKLFDWTLEEMPIPGMPPYTMIKVGDGTGGGMFENPDPAMPKHWLAYVDVDDIQAATDKARKLGATVLQDVTEVSNYGWFSIIKDPTGAVLGMWKTSDNHPSP